MQQSNKKYGHPLAEKTLLQQKPVEIFVVLFFAMVSNLCFVLGLFSPFIEISHFWFFKHIVTLVNSILQLWSSHDYFLLIVIFLFTIIVPIVKSLFLFYICLMATPRQALKLLYFLHLIGKWSMLDVFVIAIMIVAIKLGALLTVELHFGIMFFAIAIILINLLAQYLFVLCKKLSHSNSYAN